MSKHLPDPPSTLPFSVLQRMMHIERCLFWKGELQRADLVGQFGINPAQAALDFRRYMTLAPGGMEYDKQRKRYLSLPGFEPHFIAPTGLDEFRDLPTKRVPIEPWPLPQREASANSLKRVVRAVQERWALEIQYQSMSNDDASMRWISPHAFASDGTRWHVRAYCHTHEEFRDFVVGRILKAGRTKAAAVDSMADEAWQTKIIVRLEPNPALSPAQKKAIAAEYNMGRRGYLTLTLRKAMLFYLKARLEPAPLSLPAAHQLVIHVV